MSFNANVILYNDLMENLYTSFLGSCENIGTLPTQPSGIVFEGLSPEYTWTDFATGNGVHDTSWGANNQGPALANAEWGWGHPGPHNHLWNNPSFGPHQSSNNFITSVGGGGNIQRIRTRAQATHNTNPFHNNVPATTVRTHWDDFLAHRKITATTFNNNQISIRELIHIINNIMAFATRRLVIVSWRGSTTRRRYYNNADIALTAYPELTFINDMSFTDADVDVLINDAINSFDIVAKQFIVPLRYRINIP